MKLFLLCLCTLLAGCGSGVRVAGLNTAATVVSGHPALTDRNGTPLHTVLPAHFDNSKTHRWVIFNHGFGQAGNTIREGDPLTESLADALAAAGYVVVSSDYRLENCWGNAMCVEDMRNLYDAYRSTLNLDERPFVVGTSMGGLVTWNAVLHGALTPRGMVGIFPVCNLASMYTNPYFVASMEADYDFRGASELDAAIAGYDPLRAATLQPLTGFPILVWASYTDTVVSRPDNIDRMATAVTSLGGSVTVLTSTGEHGDASNYHPDAVVRFFNSIP